jgi:hypothetical protein
VDIPDAVFRHAKAVAALEGKSLKTFVLEAITRELESRATPKAGPKRVQLPLISSKRPGSLCITGDTIADALNAEDLHVLA